LYFQSLDDKTECVGIYADGQLIFDNISDDLTRTWRHTGTLSNEQVEYAWIRCNGQSLSEVCPEELAPTLARVQSRFKAYLQSFRIAKIDLRELCFFDLVPQDFLLEFCEIKNKITKHVFENYDKPENYEHIAAVHRLLHKFKFKELNVNNQGCRSLFSATTDRTKIQKILTGSRYIDYNLFGTVTGRLTTCPDSLPILTMKKEYRKLIKPHNDWLLSLDYNGAELRTVLALDGQEQPDWDIHQWNAKNVFAGLVSRNEAKEQFFAWLYNPESEVIKSERYNRQKTLSAYYDGNTIETPMGRKIKVDERRAFNYLVQSTTADIVLDRAVQLDKFLKDKKSYVSHIVHDEIVIDLANSERDLVPQIKDIFENNKLDKFPCNLTAGKNYYELQDLQL
jgi:hypothetical protein